MAQTANERMALKVSTPMGGVLASMPWEGHRRAMILYTTLSPVYSTLIARVDGEVEEVQDIHGEDGWESGW